MQEIPFQVRDARSNEDISRSILLQIIMEQEEDGEPIFSEQVLEKIIRFYGDSLQGVMTSYLERSLSLFVDQQSRIQEQMTQMLGNDPLAMIREMTERNFSMWQEMQEGFVRAAMKSAPGPASRGKEGSVGGDE